jgi:hypothetical protein
MVKLKTEGIKTNDKEIQRSNESRRKKFLNIGTDQKTPSGTDDIRYMLSSKAPTARASYQNMDSVKGNQKWGFLVLPSSFSIGSKSTTLAAPLLTQTPAV